MQCGTIVTVFPTNVAIRFCLSQFTSSSLPRPRAWTDAPAFLSSPYPEEAQVGGQPGQLPPTQGQIHFCSLKRGDSETAARGASGVGGQRVALPVPGDTVREEVLIPVCTWLP